MIQNEVWVERFRPESLTEVIGHDKTIARLQDWVDDDSMPNLLLHGPAGTGKTATVVAFAKDKYGDRWSSNLIEMNASDERGIDVVRDRIKSLAKQSPAGDFGYKIIYLDEADSLCLPPGTEVITGYPSESNQEIKKIENVSTDSEPIPSVDFETNKIQSDKGKAIETGTQDFYKMELSDGREVIASLNHPFFTVQQESQKLIEKELGELSEGDEIADFSTEIGVKECEVCGDFTTNSRYCSVECKDHGHSKEISGDGNPMFGKEWSDEKREKIVEKLSDGRLSGEDNPNFGGHFHGSHWKDMSEQAREEAVEKLSASHRGKKLSKEHRDSIARSLKETFGGDVSEKYESANYRYHLKGENETDCEICGETKKVGGRDGIYVHHIDGDRSNNSEENLKNVCPTCHNFVCHERWEDINEGWKENDYRKDIVGNGGRQNVKTVEVESIEYDHHGKAYNITMEGTPNFMLANGILTHNTNDAQAALRRIMEQYADNTRFILSCNYPNKLIDPIQSRCISLPFKRLDNHQVKQLLERICEKADVKYEDEAIDSIVDYTSGDARRAVHTLQTSVDEGVLTTDIIDVVSQTVPQDKIDEMIENAASANMEEAQETLIYDIVPEVTDYSKFASSLMNAIKYNDTIEDDVRWYMISRLGETERNIQEGSNPHVQLGSFLAQIPVARNASIPNYE